VEHLKCVRCGIEATKMCNYNEPIPLCDEHAEFHERTCSKESITTIKKDKNNDSTRNS
jgi:hypothetical protein